MQTDRRWRAQVARRAVTLGALAALLALGACQGQDPGGDGAPSEQPEAIVDAPYTPQPGMLVRLTQAQYTNTVRDLLGEDVVAPARLEPDVRAGDLIAVGAAKATISARGAELYEDAAYDLARQAMAPGKREELLSCEPAGVTDDDCARAFLAQFGRRAWRRPLTDAELDRLVDVARNAGEVLGDFHGGLEYAIAAVLQSPKFLFRVEVGKREVEGGRRALDDFELATRLSYFLWNTAPDEELLAAAEAGELSTDEGLRAQAQRMIADDRARRGVRTFFADFYELDRLDDLTKAPENFEHISEDVGPFAREETLRVIEDLVFDQRGDFRDLLTTRRTFLNRKLASIYSVRAPAREGFAATELPEDQMRRGLLGHASILALYAHPVSTSPTLRGMFIRRKLLCQPIPAPPAGVDTSIPEPSGDAPTLRDRIAQHLEEPTCAGCHRIMDPLGLGMEHFDGIGRFRTRDNGVTIDASGELDGVTFDDFTGLTQALHDHARLSRCVTRKLQEYATGHEVASGEQELTDALDARFAASGYDLLTLIEDLIMSPAFRTTAAPSQDEEEE